MRSVRSGPILTIVIWAAATVLVLAVTALTDDWWRAEVGYVLAAIMVFAAWVTTNLVLTRMDAQVPYEPYSPLAALMPELPSTTAGPRVVEFRRPERSRQAR